MVVTNAHRRAGGLASGSPTKPARFSPYDAVRVVIERVRVCPLGYAFLVAACCSLVLSVFIVESAPVTQSQRRSEAVREIQSRRGDMLLMGGGFLLVSGSILVAGSHRRKD